MKKIFLILTLALVALAGCKKEPAPGPGPGLTPDTPTTIVFKTSRAVGETITLGFRRSEMQNISMDGAKAESALPAGDWGIYTCKLSSQTVTIKGDITLFDCKNSGITEIVLTKDLKLFDFNCSENELTSLDVSGLTELETFACSSNRLTSLNIEGCDKLCYVECYSNSIKDEAMTDIVNDLPKLDTPGAGSLVVTAEGCGNVITQDDIDIAIDKNWDVVDDKFHSISQRTTFTCPANCYIVTKAGEYAFKAVMGNSSESIGSVASAEVLWETFGTDVAPAVGDLISSVSYKDGKIVFKTTDKKGNAVIAAKDASGEILWSWHIWMTDQPQEQVYYNNAGIMMDRNLGAISTTPGDAGTFGLIYQWGRKDPFLGAYTAANAPAKSTITWPSPVSSDSSNGTIEYATANPTTFIINNSNNEDWYYTGSESTDDTRWTTSETSKSIYDPCPAGWRVPDGGDNGVWSKARGSSSDFENSSSFDWYKAYTNFSGIFGSESTILYPAGGIYNQYEGTLTNVRSTGNYWSASKAMTSSRAKCLTFDYKGAVRPSNNTTRVTGCSVRCVKE